MPEPPVFTQDDVDNLELVRQIIVNRLKQDAGWDSFAPHCWDENAADWVIIALPSLRTRFIELANEVMWQLIIQGVISPGRDSYSIGPPFFHITSYGREVLQSEHVPPHDPTGYMKRLRELSRTAVTDVAIAYVEEALRCFMGGCPIAATLLLGVAAESVVLGLLDALEAAGRRPRRSARTIKPKHEWLVSQYKEDKAGLPESLGFTLTLLYDMIRRQRNELGHPQEAPPNVSREEAYVYFRLFLEFVADAEALAAHFRQLVPAADDTAP